mgnify:CR=1 FL=1
MLKNWMIALLALPMMLSAEISSQDALKKLQEGNQRYVSEDLLHPNRGQERQRELANKQKPFAVILTCSDSRVAPEILFDQGLGDLFVVRIAGNVVGPTVLDSIEYGVVHLGASLVLVLGHENCGAVEAVMMGQTKDIEAIAEKIEPAIKGIQLTQNGGLEKAIKSNVVSIASYLKKSPALAKAMQDGKLKIETGYLQLKEGNIEFGF